MLMRWLKVAKKLFYAPLFFTKKNATVCILNFRTAFFLCDTESLALLTCFKLPNLTVRKYCVRTGALWSLCTGRYFEKLGNKHSRLTVE